MQPDPKKVSRMEDGKWVEQSKYFDGVNFSPIPPARDTLLLPTRERDKRDELPTLLSNLSDAEFPREIIDKIHDETKKMLRVCYVMDFYQPRILIYLMLYCIHFLKKKKIMT